jgi:transitional endoplasmic reticulum ATPase
MQQPDVIRSLREALKHSPDNIPLRLHLAQTLLAHGMPAEAEQEFRDALVQRPQEAALEVGLARAFAEQGKATAALVLLEELVKRQACPPEAFVMHARLLVARGEVRTAVAQYKLGVEREPAVADRALEEQLGIGDEFREQEVHDGRVREGWEPSAAGPEIERPAISFADLGGMESVKEEIRIKIIHPLANPELFRAYGKAVGGGILMYGPPGCGKTHLARATAGEIKAGFISVGIADVLDMWVGTSERNLRDLFANARRSAPCVLFFDEVDALGARRSDMIKSGGRQLINQFLAELDGVGASNEGVLILAATNSPWHLDPAFRRPGRFDRVLFVPPPDATAREQILRILCRGKPTSGIDHLAVAKKTADFSGADLKAVVDKAIEVKLHESLKKGAPQPLATGDLMSAASGLRPTTKEWFATARNHALYANEGGAYDDVLRYLGVKR